MGISKWLFGKIQHNNNGGHHQKNGGHHNQYNQPAQRGSYGEVGYACPTCRTINSATSRFCRNALIWLNEDSVAYDQFFDRNFAGLAVSPNCCFIRC